MASLLASARLVTLAGSGGIGKTRLAIAVAESVATTFPDGVWFVDLASYSDGAFVLPAVTAILGVRVEPGRPQAETLARFLAAKSLLLILDNCEHLLPHCARLADALLQACPGLRILATSRQTLNYPGEGAWRVPSLELPAADTLQNGSLQNGSLQQMMQADAVRLFVERAMDASPAFLLTDRNVKAVVEVCRRLDGIPLAIELAAARVKVLSVEQIAARLNDRFRLLTGGSPAALPRQQTLQACTDWSYDLLSALGKVLLRRLSVFAGGWTLEAAETVCTGNGVGQDALLDLLAELADKSLVIVEEVEGAARYRLLETIRQYGQERLRESGEAAGVGRRHLEYYLRLAESVPEQRTGPDQMSWFARLERDHDNLRTAYRFAIGDETFTGRSPAASPPDGRATTELALRLCAALRRFWELKGHVAEGREWCALALGQQEAPGETQARAEALNCAGALAAFLGEYADARQCLQESLGVYRKLGHRRGIASSLADLGLVTRELGDYAGALAYDEESLALYRELGDRPGISALLSNLGLVAENQGDYRLARSYYEESLSIRRKMGHKAGIGATVHGLGLLAFRQGHNTTARHLYEEALELYRQLGDRAGIAWLFNNLGLLAYREGQYTEARAYHTESLSVFREIGTRLGIAYALEAFAGLAATEAPLSLEAPAPEIRRAACLWGAAERLREEIGIPLPSSERAEREQQVARVRSALGEDAFMTAYTAGSEMSMEAAIEYSLRT